MNQWPKRHALLMATFLTALALGSADAQEDLFAPLRQAPVELQDLFRDQAQPRLELPEAIRVLAEKRAERGGAAQAHVLMSFDGPLTAEMRTQLEGNGVRILDRFDGNTWIATVDQAGAEFVQKGDIVRGATILPPQAKLSDTISLRQPFDWQRRPGEDGLGYSVLFHKGVSADEAYAALSEIADGELPAVDAAAFPYVRQVVVTLTTEQLAAAAALDVVQHIEPQAPPNEDQNRNNTQPVSNVDDVQVAPYNLTGAGVTVGIWESVDIARPSHQDLTPRVTVQPGQGNSQDGHALHVAGTIELSGAAA